MNSFGTSHRILFAALLIALTGLFALAQQGHQHGQGQMQGKGMMGEGRMQDMQTIHALLDDHKQIARTVREIENGVETTTESDDPKVRARIVEHAWAMQKRLETRQPIRMWDPLFAELFKHADKIKLQITNTPKGVKITETSTDVYVVKLIRAHAAGVSEFVKEGSAVMHNSHEVPGAATVVKTFPGRGDGLTTCPVTGEPVDKNISAEIQGRTVYFCCANCRDAVNRNPEVYLKTRED